jgi:uncharacterized protein YbjQ (UPF0145 family)
LLALDAGLAVARVVAFDALALNAVALGASALVEVEFVSPLIFGASDYIVVWRC